MTLSPPIPARLLCTPATAPSVQKLGRWVETEQLPCPNFMFKSEEFLGGA